MHSVHVADITPILSLGTFTLAQLALARLRLHWLRYQENVGGAKAVVLLYITASELLRSER